VENDKQVEKASPRRKIAMRLFGVMGGIALAGLTKKAL